jgi:hypothetical protein
LADRLRSIGHTFFVATPAQGSFRIGWVWLSPARSSSVLVVTTRAGYLS